MDSESSREAVSQTIGQLAARWAKADRRILRAVFPLLVEGRPVSVRRIADVTASTPAAVESALKAGRAGRDVQGAVVELAGLMLSPTMHRLVIGEVALFSCCALLAHLVPALIDRGVRIESVDPASRRIVSVRIAPDGLAEVSPVEAVASFVRTEASGMTGQVGEMFCRHIHHFTSPESARAFVEADPHRYAISMKDLHHAARSLYQQAWTD